MGKPFVSNIISQKYDTALDFYVTMYDNLPYQRDTEYCNVEKLALVSGHVIKYYLCLGQEEAFLIDNKDDIIEEILANEQQSSSGTVSRRKAVSPPPIEGEITPEQIQTLLDDNLGPDDDFPEDSFADGFDNDVDAPANAVNAFADVADW